MLQTRIESSSSGHERTGGWPFGKPRIPWRGRSRPCASAASIARILDRLRERRHLEHQGVALREEQQSLDEFAVLRFSRSKPCPGSLNQVLSRIHEIQSLLGQKPQPNEVFGEEMTRSTRAQSDRERDRTGSVATGSDFPVRGHRSSASLGQTPDELSSLVDEAASRTGLPVELISSVIATEFR